MNANEWDGLAYQVEKLGQECRKNSERWFPEMHGENAIVDPWVHYTLGMAGEVGEFCNDVKKAFRHLDELPPMDVASKELADVFTYLLLIADDLGINLVHATRLKQEEIEAKHAS